MKELGKIPPQDIDLEEAILGVIMLEKDAIDNVLHLLKPESFYKDAHQKIYRSMLELYKANEPIDILTVNNNLRKNKHIDEVGGPSYISYLTSKIISTANIEYHAMVIAEKFMRRELIRTRSEIIEMAYNESADMQDILSLDTRSVEEIISVASGNEEIKLIDAVRDVVNTIEKVSIGEIKLTGIKSGYTQLDRYTQGWQSSDLIILAARPSMGKTAFALDMAKNAALDVPVAFFSLEMTVNQLATRLISNKTNYSPMELREARNINWLTMEAGIKQLYELPLYFDDNSRLTHLQIRAKIRKLVKKYGVKIVFVDYLQLMKGEGFNREQEIASISRSLKSTAKEFNIPIVALAQLSRETEKRGGTKRPQLSDLRESGAIEQDADVVIFINRPERYGIEQYDDGTPTKGMAELIIAKQRNGACTDVLIKHNDFLTRFDNEADIDFGQLN